MKTIKDSTYRKQFNSTKKLFVIKTLKKIK